ncbi:MAG: FkbM family methyltransferase [Rubrivivax sp.]|nr:FkbM family methyltransferase [Rubrivivax sp.]
MSTLRRNLLKAICRFNRLHQSYPGRWRLCRFLASQTEALKTIPAGPIAVGPKTCLFIDPQQRTNGLKIYVHGLNPREPLANIAVQVLRLGDTVIDIGANVGYFSALCSLSIGPSGRVLSYEAAPGTYQRLQTLSQKNLHRNITTFPYAVSNEAGEITFHCGPAEHSGIASIRPLGEKSLGAITVKAIALDDILDELPKIRLVKIDVEGAETLVALGMQKLIERDRPYVITEVTDSFLRQLGSDKHQLLNAFTRHGYTAHRIGRQVTEYAREDPEFQCDLILVPEGHAIPGFSTSLVRIGT